MLIIATLTPPSPGRPIVNLIGWRISRNKSVCYIICWCLFMTDFSYTYLLPFKWINYHLILSRFLSSIYVLILPASSKNAWATSSLFSSVSVFNGISYCFWLLFTQQTHEREKEARAWTGKLTRKWINERSLKWQRFESHERETETFTMILSAFL